MSSDFTFEDKGKVQPKPAQEAAEPEKDGGPQGTLTGRLDAGALTHMQQTVGNSAVQRFLAQRAKAPGGSGPGEIDDQTAAAINADRGSGQELDEGIAGRAGSVMGRDFGDVKVHADSQADALSRQLGAKAFTTGKDIFFRAGAYNPTSGEGQQLISHELTHVAQQGATPPAVQGQMMVNDPNDQFEAEADNVAGVVMNQPDEGLVQQQALPEEEEEMVQQQEMLPEEEEEEEGR
ncbi:MAG: DUF4157 domain-containing protein [Chloroflexi bacterium]|nr:DUF4157 domain-containing protein [Chloroflexota bacterium]MCI0574693.1 DUF4157 domain-containing protein [Chloroflexota bacterium]MCI0647414.1 DUF4157 domain-containing protein [Chloroflexota bacterium]MCI0725273.1 DUF4157 domain-containing protein [Chloroflexota bacterium]